MSLLRLLLPQLVLGGDPITATVKKSPTSAAPVLQERTDAKREVEKQGMELKANDLKQKIKEAGEAQKKKEKEGTEGTGQGEKAEEGEEAKPKKPKSFLERVADDIKNKFKSGFDEIKRDLVNPVAKQVESVKEEVGALKNLGKALTGGGADKQRRDALTGGGSEEQQKQLAGVIASAVAGAEKSQDQIGRALDGGRQEGAIGSTGEEVSAADAQKQQADFEKVKAQAQAGFQNADDVAGQALGAQAQQAAKDEKAGKGTTGVAAGLASASAGLSGDPDKIAGGQIQSKIDGIQNDIKRAELLGLETGGFQKSLLVLQSDLVKIDPSAKNKEALLETEAKVLEIKAGEIKERLGKRGIGSASPEERVALLKEQVQVQKAQAQNKFDLATLNGDAPDEKELKTQLENLDKKIQAIDAEAQKNNIGTNASATAGATKPGQEGSDFSIQGGTNAIFKGAQTASANQLTASNQALDAASVALGRTTKTSADAGALASNTAASQFADASVSVVNGKNTANIAKGQIEALQKQEVELRENKTELETKLRQEVDPEKKRTLETQIHAVDEQLAANTTKTTEQKQALRQAEEQVASQQAKINTILKDPVQRAAILNDKAAVTALVNDPASRAQLAVAAGNTFRSGDPSNPGTLGRQTFNTSETGAVANEFLHNQQAANEILAAVGNSGASTRDKLDFLKSYGKQVRGPSEFNAADNPLAQSLIKAYMGNAPQAPTVTPTASVPEVATTTAPTGPTEATFKVKGATVKGGKDYDTVGKLNERLQELGIGAQIGVYDQNSPDERNKLKDSLLGHATDVNGREVGDETRKSFKKGKQTGVDAISEGESLTLRLSEEDKATVRANFARQSPEKQKEMLANNIQRAVILASADPAFIAQIKDEGVKADISRNSLPGMTGEVTPARLSTALQTTDNQRGVGPPLTAEDGRREQRRAEVSHPALSPAKVMETIAEIRRDPSKQTDPNILQSLGIGEEKAKQIAAIQDPAQREQAIKEAVLATGVFSAEASRLRGVVQQVQTSFGTGDSSLTSQQQQQKAQETLTARLGADTNYTALHGQAESFVTQQVGAQFQQLKQQRSTGDISEQDLSQRSRGIAQQLNNVAGSNPELSAQLANGFIAQDKELGSQILGHAYSLNRDAAQSTISGLNQQSVDAVNQSGAAGLGLIRNQDGSTTVLEVNQAIADRAAGRVQQNGVFTKTDNDLVKLIGHHDPEFLKAPNPEQAKQLGPALAIYENQGASSMTPAELKTLPVDDQTKIKVGALLSSDLADRADFLRGRISSRMEPEYMKAKYTRELAVVERRQEQVQTVLTETARNLKRAQERPPSTAETLEV